MEDLSPFHVNNFVVKKQDEVKIYDLKIGDIVYVVYITFSQKDIDDYPPVLGKVYEIDENNVYIYYDKDKRYFQEIELPGCGWFGHKGYEYSIYLVK